MSASSVATKMTFVQFLEWCDEDTFAEWVDGEVVPISPVGLEHQYVAGFLLENYPSLRRRQGAGGCAA